MIPKPAAPFCHSIFLLQCNTIASTAIQRKMMATAAQKNFVAECQAGDISK